MRHLTKLDSSQRLQDILAILSDGNPHQAITIQQATLSLSLATDISELRANGFEIKQWYAGKTENGRSKSVYRLIKQDQQLSMAI